MSPSSNIVGHIGVELTDRTLSLAMELLDQYENHVAANALFYTLLGMSGRDVNQGDSTGMTPHGLAEKGGQGEALELLLGQEAVSPHKADNLGRTPVSWAAIEGHESVVKQLWGRQDVSPDKADNGGRTPVLLAAIEGH